ncbi:MAG: hypothetical protein ACLPVF_20710 [Acidimicrobiales bacterium]
MLGFFSFTEITDPSAHRAYNEWHRLDHMPEQFSLDGILFGQRWVCAPWCRRSRVAVSPLLEPCHYMTLYLMRDASVLPGFAALAEHLRRADRFFAARVAHLSGPFPVRDRWVAPRIKVSPAAVPFRPAEGIYVIVGPAVDGAALVGLDGVAGAWGFADDDGNRHITVAFVDGELAVVAEDLGHWCAERNPVSQAMEWAGPLERIDADSGDWFDRLTPL